MAYIEENGIFMSNFFQVEHINPHRVNDCPACKKLGLSSPPRKELQSRNRISQVSRKAVQSKETQIQEDQGTLIHQALFKYPMRPQTEVPIENKLASTTRKPKRKTPSWVPTNLVPTCTILKNNLQKVRTETKVKKEGSKDR